MCFKKKVPLIIIVLLWAKLRYDYKDGRYIDSNEVSLL